MGQKRNPVVTVEMASGSRYAFELHPDWAPNAVNSVIHLAKAGLYDGHAVGRIVPGFVIQPIFSEDVAPQMDYAIDGEFAANGFEGNPPVVTGTVAMAGDSKTFSSGCSFFITLGEHPRLTGHFTAIGTIIEGWEEIKRIEAVDTVPLDSGTPDVQIHRPVSPEVMTRVTVETFGVDYPAPVIIENR